MSAYSHNGAGSAPPEAGQRPPLTFAERRFARERYKASHHTAGMCARGCCWTPWAPGVCALKRMCACHYEPAPEIIYTPPVDYVTDDFTTSTEDWQEAA